MTKKSHNKKRNVGIIYEQLILTVSKGIVENNRATVASAKKIIKKHFSPGTELYREHKLFQALVKPYIDNDSLATAILGEAKKASRAHDYNRLEREKSILIRDINLTFGKQFYKTRVREYKDYATIQTLLNDWRTKNADISRVVEFEQKAHTILTREKSLKTLKEQQTPEIDNLVVKIMTEKFNNKYGARLSDQQRNLIKKYVMSEAKPNFSSTLESIKETCIADLKKYMVTCESQIVKAKIKPVLNELSTLNTKNINDETFSRFMLLCQLQTELKERKQ